MPITRPPDGVHLVDMVVKWTNISPSPRYGYLLTLVVVMPVVRASCIAAEKAEVTHLIERLLDCDQH